MRDRRDESSEAALAERLFAEARDDGVAIHPAVGVRIKEAIEDALERKRSRGRRMLWRTSPLAAALAAVAVVFFFEGSRAPPAAIPGVVVRGPDADTVSSLVRARHHPVTIELARGVSIEVRPEAALIPTPSPEVLDGEVLFRVADLAPGELFLARAAGVSVAAVSGTFEIRRLGGRVDVRVQSGSAEVEHAAQKRIIRTGESWSTEAPVVEEPATSSRVSRLLEASSQLVTPRARSRPARPAASAGPGPQDLRIDLEPPSHERTLLERAAERLRADDLDGARAIYRELAGGEAAGAALGWYLLARLEATHAHRPAQALAALEAFLARFPEHELAAEASASRIEALLELRRCEDAGRALAAYRGVSDLVAVSRSRHREECGERSAPIDH